MKGQTNTRRVRYRIFLSLLAVFFLFIPTVSLAGYVGTNIPISDKAYDQQSPHTIYLTDPFNPTKGLWLTVWEDWRRYSTTGADIYGQFIDQNGKLCGPEILIASGTRTEQFAYGTGDPSYSGTITDRPIIRTTVTVWANTNSGLQTCTDNGLGSLSGGCSGTVNYSTGAVTVLFTDSVAGGELVYVRSTSQSNQTAPRAAYRTFDGRVVVVWQDTRPDYLYYNTLTGINFNNCNVFVGEETPVGYTPLSVYDPSTLRRTDIRGDIIGQGDGSINSFNDSLFYQNIVPSSVTVTDGTQSCTDDGVGNFTATGTCGGGSIDYDTGAISGLGFASAPANTMPIYAQYKYTKDITASQVIGTGNGAAMTFAGVLAHTPVTVPASAPPGSVSVTAEKTAGGLMVCTDDGAGSFPTVPGNCTGGTIDYNNGNITVSFPLFVKNQGQVSVNYKYVFNSDMIKGEPIATGNGVSTSFGASLTYDPVVPGTVDVAAGGQGFFDDSHGTILCGTSACGTINYNSGQVSLAYPSATPPPDGTPVTVAYQFYQRTTDVTVEVVSVGDGSSDVFDFTLGTSPVVPGTVSRPLSISDGVQFCVDAHGTGSFEVMLGCEGGTIDYETGAVSITFSTPPAGGEDILARYSYYSFPVAKVVGSDRPIARQLPRIAYDLTGNQFWIVWKETRNVLRRISELCFADSVGNESSVANWSFDDADLIGYVRLDGDLLNEKPSLIGVNGADIVRNTNTSTVRLVSNSRAPLVEVYNFESFQLATNPDVSCDSTSSHCTIVWEGKRMKQTLTCNCNDKNKNDSCDLADILSNTLEGSSFDDGFVHIYGLADNYVPLGTVSSVKLDSATGSDAHYPSLGFDPVTKRFLAAWEDLRGGPNTKIYGQLLLSGGGKYNADFLISFNDLDKNGTNDTNVVNSKQSRPFVSYDPVNQRFFVVWQDGRNGTLSLENLDIFGQKLDAEGSLRGDNYPIFTLPDNQYYPTIAYNDAVNQFLAVWKDARNADISTCSTKFGAGTGAKPCGSDVYGQRFTLQQPALTLLNLDNTPLTPPLLSGYENPAGAGTVEAGLADVKSFKIRNTGDTTLKIDFIDETCNGTLTDISPFSFDGLPSQLTAELDGNTVDLVPTAELTLTVRFAPTVGGSYNKCFIIKSDGGNAQVNLSALSIESNITVTPTSFDFGSVNVGSTKDQTFVVKNTGTATLRITTLDNPSSPFSIQTDGCSGQSVAPGLTCNIVVRFTPEATGAAIPSSFNINSNDPDTPILVVSPLDGTGNGAPNKDVTPLSINFGSVQKGQSSAIQTITITSTGTSALHISSITGPSTPFSVDNTGVSDACGNPPFDLATGASCNIGYKFTPVINGGVLGTVKITTNASPADATVTLSGTGVVTPVITAIPNPVVFPSMMVGSSVQKIIKVGNVGTANLTLSGIVNPTGEFKIIGNTCYGTLKVPPLTPNNCKITVSFTPTSEGFKTSSFTIKSNDPVNPVYTVDLVGTGTVAPKISVTPNPLAFGNKLVGSTTSLNLTVKNTGNAALTVTGVSDPALTQYSITANTCLGSPVAAGGSCIITVTFAPDASGSYPDSITIASDDVTTGPVTVTLSGTSSLGQNISVDTLSLAFTDTRVGTKSATQTVTISNTGGIDLKLNSIIYPGVPFNVVSKTCTPLPYTVGAGSSCSITFLFNPTMKGSYTRYLTINSNDPDQAQVKVTLTGRGI